MSTVPRNPTTAGTLAPAITALGGALAFVVCYLAVDPVAGQVATAPLPLPGAPPDEVFACVTANAPAVALTALCQLASVAGLLVFVLATRCALVGAADRRVRWGQVSLGGFVWLTRTAFPDRGVRILGLVAAVPALLSVASLAWFYASALILFGRLLCIVWTVAAGAALVRRARAVTG